jgi:hypothetical protein
MLARAGGQELPFPKTLMENNSTIEYMLTRFKCRASEYFF